MYRGTTPVHTYTVPYRADSIQRVYITYSQNGEPVVEKTIDDVTISPIDDSTCNVVAHLTQNDTLKFSVGEANVQLRILDTNGEAYASAEMRMRIDDILKDGVI